MSEYALSNRFYDYGQGYISRPLIYKRRRQVRSQQSLDGVSRTPHAVVRQATVEPSVAVKTPAQQYVQAPAVKTQSTKVTRRSRRATLRTVIPSVAACLVLMVGGYVLVSTLKTNKAVEQQVNSGVLAADSGGPNIDETPVDKAAVGSYRVASDMPRAIRISSLGVEARVLRVGVTAGGEIDTPKNIYDAGWYDGSSKPGTSGAALIVGHYSGRTKDAVFAGLKKLNADDLIEVERGDGTKISYKVVDKKQFSADNVDLASALTPITAGKPGLNLITCGGKFDDKTETFAERTIIYTEQI